MSASLTFLHTSRSHVERFELLRAELEPQTPARHVVNEALLTQAVEDGRITSALEKVVEQEIGALASVSRVILCTCSTLGAIAEKLDGMHGARIVRVDRPLARKAVHLGTRLAVVASLENTLAPTTELLEEEAQRAGLSPELTVSLADGAWQRLVAGDQEGYLKLVGEHAARVAADADVVLLAQASMQGAQRYACTRVPILASPGPGLEHAFELLSNCRDES